MSQIDADEDGSAFIRVHLRHLRITQTMKLAIETYELTKWYRGLLGRNAFAAVDHLDLQVPCGQVFGFLGPNGAGKTTTIMMLLGNVRPSAGHARLLGRPVGHVEAKRRIGFLPEKFQFHDLLQADEFLELNGKLYGMGRAERRRRIDEVLELVGLADRRRDRLGQFSKGMQQRIGLAQALMHEPELVILDEPTSALDPIGRRQVRDVVLRLKSAGTTVFLNSHLLSEIELTCDQVAILKRGRLVKQGPIDALLAPPSTVELRLEQVTPAITASLAALGRLSAGEAGLLQVEVENARRIPEVAEAVIRGGGRLLSMVARRETLEELFVRVVGEP
jgi:ABC-2 type transport system ATP-binding protein